MHNAPRRQDSILHHPHGNLPLSPGRRRRPLWRPHARRGSASPSALYLPQDPPPNHADQLTRPKADDRPREARDAEERIYRIEGLRDVREGAIGKDDEEIEEDCRGDDEWGEEVDGDGDDG